LSPLFETKTYTCCRNDRVELKPPTENRRHAFCCRQCYVTWYRKHCLVCDDATGPRSPEERYPTRNLCGRSDCRSAFRRNPAIFEAFGVPNGPKSAALLRRGLDQTGLGVTPPAADPHEISTSDGVSGRSPVASADRLRWSDWQGRGWRWEVDGEDDWLLLDHVGRLAVHLNRQAAGWRVVHPRIVPEAIEPDLDAAKVRAQTLALASLPLHPATRRHYAG
jgi:hypothetical protein